MLLIDRRIGQTRLMEPPPAKLAAVAMSTSSPLGVRVVAAHRHAVIDPQANPFMNNLCFGLLNKWRMDPKRASSLHACLGCHVGQALEFREELGSAIRIAAIVNSV